MRDIPKDISEDSLAQTDDFWDGGDSSKVTLRQSLDALPLIERKYGMDARSEPSRGEIEHLCKVWADVGRAILKRRRAGR